MGEKNSPKTPCVFFAAIAFPDARAESAEGAESFHIEFSRRLGGEIGLALRTDYGLCYPESILPWAFAVNRKS